MVGLAAVQAPANPPGRGRFRPSRCGGPLDESGPWGCETGPIPRRRRRSAPRRLDQVIVGWPDQPIALIAVTGGVVDQPGGALPDPGRLGLGSGGCRRRCRLGKHGGGIALVHVRRLLSAPVGDGHDNRTPRADRFGPARRRLAALVCAVHSRSAGEGLELWPTAGAPSRNARPAINRPARRGSFPRWAGGWWSAAAGRGCLDGLGHAPYVSDLDLAGFGLLGYGDGDG